MLKNNKLIVSEIKKSTKFHFKSGFDRMFFMPLSLTALIWGGAADLTG